MVVNAASARQLQLRAQGLDKRQNARWFGMEQGLMVAPFKYLGAGRTQH